MRRVIFVLALMLFPGTAIGMSFSAPLNDLVGVVDFPESTAGKEATFDFGQQFSEIESVWIEIEAHVFAREFDVCGTFFDPQPCVHIVQLTGFFAIIDEEDKPFLGAIFSNGLSFGDFDALEGYGVDVASFTNRSGWDILLDGEGSLTLYWNAAGGDPDRIIQNFTDQSGQIFSARLIIEGTPVPEPSTSALLATALLTVKLIALARKQGAETIS